MLKDIDQPNNITCLSNVETFRTNNSRTYEAFIWC